MPTTPPISLSALWPELILLVGSCVVLLSGQFPGGGVRRWASWASLVTIALAILAVVLGQRSDAAVAGNGLYFGSLATFVRMAALGVAVPLVLVNWSQSRSQERGEFLSMMLMSLAGLLMIGPSDNLLILFLALEIVSIPTYVMVVLSRGNLRSAEAGTKYFYLGALSAAVMGYGFAFLYGVGGTASLGGMVAAVSAALKTPGTLEFALATIGIVLSIGGLLFKLAAVPLHAYIADVYHGAASPVAGLLGFVPKLAGVIAVMKIVAITSFWTDGCAGVYWLLWVVAAASMTVGNVLALQQTNIKRMLAYSGIAHAGYMLVGILAGPLAGENVAAGGIGVMGNGVAAVLYYVVIYGVANLAAFAVLGLLRVRNGVCETLVDVAGLIRREPTMALLLVLAMFTLMGLPPTPGFWGKLSLFGSAITASRGGSDTWLMVLVIIAVLNSAVAAAYYLRVIAAMLIYENQRPAFAMNRGAEQIGAQLCGFLLIIFALYPNNLLSQGQNGSVELATPRPIVTPADPTPGVTHRDLPSAEHVADLQPDSGAEDGDSSDAGSRL